MPWCPYCREEFVDGIRSCSDCGADLVSWEPPGGGRALPRDPEDSGAALLLETHSRSECRAIEKLLQANAVPVHHKSNFDGTVLELYVPSLSLASALAVLERNGVLTQDVPPPPPEGVPVHMVVADGFVFDDMDNLLLIQNDRGWEPPGGCVEVGEGVVEALLREIREETGVEARVRALAAVNSLLPGKTPEGEPMPAAVCLDFVLDYVSGEPLTEWELKLSGEDEVRRVAWIPCDMAWEYITSPAVQLRVDHALAHRDRPRYTALQATPDLELLEELEI